MKWPNRWTNIRHDTSAYNVLKGLKENDPLYQEFLLSWEANYCSPQTQALARLIQIKFGLDHGDANTPLHNADSPQAVQTGAALREESNDVVPDVIFVSPYDRTLETLAGLCRGWPRLRTVKVYIEERVREQEHGLSLLYNDWRVFFALHPEQKMLYDKEGPYYYRFPQGENIPDVRERCRSTTSTIMRDYAGKDVFIISHHKTILSFRANHERLNAQEYLRLDDEEKPINCGVTLYRGYPDEGANGRLKLEYYNRRFYDIAA